MQIEVKIFLVVVFEILYCYASKIRKQYSTHHGSNFSRLLNVPSFVDKSLFIKEIFKEKPKILITAPENYGKSTSLDMLKRFLEIEVDEKGIPIMSLNETKNYQLFSKNDLKITRDDVFIEQFGRYAVIFVDFKCDCDIQNLTDAVEFCKQVVHRTFKLHRYLIVSEKLTELERNLVFEWCDEVAFNDFQEVDVSLALKVLSEMLSTHFDATKSFALIDEYDSMLKAINATVTDNKELNRIQNFYFGLLGMLLTVNYHMDRAVVMGTSYWFGNKASLDAFVSYYGHLQDNVFVKYFGVTDETGSSK